MTSRKTTAQDPTAADWLRLGSEGEVLEPAELRQALLGAARAMLQRYSA